jgi:acetyltransferase-like isoleucine patch superfamily enzyme
MMVWDYEKLEDHGTPPAGLRESFGDWRFPDIVVGVPTAYGWRVEGYDPSDPHKFKLGYRTDISAFCSILAHEGVTIEPYVQLGPFCTVVSRSTIDDKRGSVVLKRNCRIGAHSVVMPGVTVGENSIVGAFSLVNKDVPSNVMGWGQPFAVVASGSRKGPARGDGPAYFKPCKACGKERMVDWSGLCMGCAVQEEMERRFGKGGPSKADARQEEGIADPKHGDVVGYGEGFIMTKYEPTLEKRWICRGFRDGDFNEWTPCAFAPCKVANPTKPDQCKHQAKQPVWHDNSRMPQWRHTRVRGE